MTIFYDNQSCIALSKDPNFHDHFKHIGIRYHYLCHQVDAKLLSLVYISVEAMFANILTKAPPKPKHCYCCHMFGLIAKLLIERGK
jgi:hypothetical protein